MNSPGHLHPLTLTTRKLVRIFEDLGFAIVTSPELETAEYNFDRLNFPQDHPARDMQDTLWVDAARNLLMRTHTSSAQIRAMEKMSPPVRLIVPGRVYRNENPDATHAIDFFQLEGFVIDQGVTMAHLMGTLEQFARQFFGAETRVHFRPSFFPFTEPSLEMSVEFNGHLLELLGAGMVHPNVLKEMNVDPTEYSGFAFGFGIDRFMAIQHGVTDIRWSYSGDYRFLKQFPGSK